MFIVVFRATTMHLACASGNASLPKMDFGIARQYDVVKSRLTISEPVVGELIICLAEEVIDLRLCEGRCFGSRVRVGFHQSLVFVNEGTARSARLKKTHRHLLMAPMVDMGVSCNMALVLYPLAFKGARGFHASGVHGSFVLTSSTGVGGHWNFMLVIVRPMYARVF